MYGHIGVALLGLTMLLFPTTGCVIVVDGDGSWGHGARVWEEATEQVAIEPAGLKAIEVRTHNGEIEFDGQPAEATGATVTIRKKAGGRSHDEAKAAMEAIEVYVERSTDGTQRLDWRWKGFKKPHWQADVAFMIKAPGSLNLDAESHNGEITITGVAGDVRVLSHNGEVKVDSRDGKLNAQTYNGAITAKYAGRNVTIETHNGEIDADLSRCAAIRGEITTHNGAVTLAVGPQTSADFSAETSNGRVSLDAPLLVTSAGRSRLEGKLGSGGERLEVVTHNGTIKIKNRAG